MPTLLPPNIEIEKAILDRGNRDRKRQSKPPNEGWPSHQASRHIHSQAGIPNSCASKCLVEGRVVVIDGPVAAGSVGDFFMLHERKEGEKNFWLNRYEANARVGWY